MIIDPNTNGVELLRRAERLIALAENNGMRRQARIVQHAFEQAINHNRPQFLNAFKRMKSVPVDIDEFMEGEDFLDGNSEDPIMSIWPTLKDDIRAMNPDVLCGAQAIQEAILGGGTGTGKTVLSTTTNMYQGYCLTCFHEPQRLFGLSPATPIIFMFQSTSQTVTKRVLYKPFRDMFTAMKYVRKHVEWDSRTEATLNVAGNIQFVPALANVESMVGQAIIGSMQDEANFMSVVENSKRVPGARGDGGKYDQAEDAYMNLTRRRTSRFDPDVHPIQFGVLCTLSSTRYKNDFMDRRMAEVAKAKAEGGGKGIHLFRKARYQANPKYVNDPNIQTFRLLVGSDRYPTRILKDGEKEGRDYPLGARIENIPVSFIDEFKRDPDGALRDVVGVATDTITAFISRRDKIVDAVIRGGELGMKDWVDNADADLGDGQWPQWIEENLPQTQGQKDKPRWVHIDLSKTKDRCGIAIIRPLGFVQRMDPKTQLMETCPEWMVECVVTLKPNLMNPIDPAEVRRWIMQLVAHYGINIKEVTFDGFQSQESQIAFIKSGIPTREVSMDISTEPYEYLRRCFYEDRMAMIEHEIVRVELSNLEYHAEKDKIDHPPKGSKDAADAVCGAIFAASTSRHLRNSIMVVDEDGENVKRPRRQVKQRRQGRPRR